MPKRELTKTEKRVLGFFGIVGAALAAYFGIRHFMPPAPEVEPDIKVISLAWE